VLFSGGSFGSPTLGIFTFLRLYLVFRVLRDHSSVRLLLMLLTLLMLLMLLVLLVLLLLTLLLRCTSSAG